MLCERCNKNQANIHIVKFMNGNKTEMWVCEKCARQVSEHPINLSKKTDAVFEFQDMIESIFSVIDKNKEDKVINEPKKDNNTPKIDIVCKNCGITYSMFKNKGQLGCMNCYENFADGLKPIIIKIHNSEEHVGKIPKSLQDKCNEKKKLNILKKELQECILKEEYEKAAVIRDKIKLLNDALNKENSYEELDR